MEQQRDGAERGWSSRGMEKAEGDWSPPIPRLGE